MINYEMALSEIEMYKKAHESLSENLTHANKKARQYKAKRDTLIDDLSRYKAEVSRLERENVGLKLMNESSNKQLEIFHRCFNSLLTKLDNNKDKDNLLSEISQHIGNKPSSNTYKYFRAKLDSIGIKEGE